jgi:hypothetical protein
LGAVVVFFREDWEMDNGERTTKALERIADSLEELVRMARTPRPIARLVVRRSATDTSPKSAAVIKPDGMVMVLLTNDGDVPGELADLLVADEAGTEIAGWISANSGTRPLSRKRVVPNETVTAVFERDPHRQPMAGSLVLKYSYAPARWPHGAEVEVPLARNPQDNSEFDVGAAVEHRRGA